LSRRSSRKRRCVRHKERSTSSTIAPVRMFQAERSPRDGEPNPPPMATASSVTNRLPTCCVVAASFLSIRLHLHSRVERPHRHARSFRHLDVRIVTVERTSRRGDLGAAFDSAVRQAWVEGGGSQLTAQKRTSSSTKRDVPHSEANRTGPTDTPSTAVGHGGASTEFSNGE
jgi:hypothetical protein